MWSTMKSVAWLQAEIHKINQWLDACTLSRLREKIADCISTFSNRSCAFRLNRPAVKIREFLEKMSVFFSQLPKLLRPLSRCEFLSQARCIYSLKSQSEKLDKQGESECNFHPCTSLNSSLLRNWFNDYKIGINVLQYWNVIGSKSEDFLRVF